MSSLLVKKLALAFLLGFGPVFLLGLVDLVDNIQEATSNKDLDLSTWGWILLSLVSGALSSGIRAIVVSLNWMPTDALHGPNAKTNSVTVTSES